MTKSQQAMAMAMLYPESQQGKQITSLQKNEVAGSYIRKARIVLRVLPSVASEVISGGTSLNDAYQQADDLLCTAEQSRGYSTSPIHHR